MARSSAYYQAIYPDYVWMNTTSVFAKGLDSKVRARTGRSAVRGPFAPGRRARSPIMLRTVQALLAIRRALHGWLGGDRES